VRKIWKIVKNMCANSGSDSKVSLKNNDKGGIGEEEYHYSYYRASDQSRVPVLPAAERGYLVALRTLSLLLQNSMERK
jgi:hypothetical protein